MTQHTPGPWTLTFRAGAWLIQAAGRVVAQIVAHDAEDEASARLIALAPEMAELLRKVVEIADGKAVHRTLEDDARAFLARLEVT